VSGCCCSPVASDALAAAHLPFIGAKLRERYLPEFWRRGTFARLEAHRDNAERVAALRLARLPYVGARMAAAWAAAGLRTPEAVQAAHAAGTLVPPLSTEWQRMAVAHARELLAEIKTADAAPLMAAVRTAASAVSGGALRVELTGGAARGKGASHDLDFLITHDVDGAEAGCLEAMLRALAASPDVERDERGQPRMLVGLSADASALAPGGSGGKTSSGRRGATGDAMPRLWRVDASDGDAADAAHGRPYANKALVFIKLRGLPLRHLDLLMVPRHQHAFWRLGWTGSRELERMLRQHVKHELRLKLSNTALTTQDGADVVTADGRRVPAAAAATQYVAARTWPATEAEVWRMIGLPWRPPEDRNA
jgi:DNA polymerase/3'-5' exonuclease PolX